MSSKVITKNDLKAVLDKVLFAWNELAEWIKHPHINSSTADTPVFYTAKRDDTDVQLAVGVGEGGVNHGVWSYALNKWLIHADNNYVYVNGSAQLGDAQTSCEKYGSVWTSGGISVYRRGRTVFCVGDPKLSAVSARTRIGTIPAGYRPVNTAYAINTNLSTYMLFYSDGQILTGGAQSATTVWFSTSWVI